MSARLHDALSVVIKVVNHIKSKSLQDRLFREFCKQNVEEFEWLVLPTEVSIPFEVNVAEIELSLQEPLIELQSDEITRAKSKDEKYNIWKTTDVTTKYPLLCERKALSRYNPNKEIVIIQPKENLDESYSYSIDYEEAKNAAQSIRMNPSDGGSLHHRTLENPSYESENSEFETNIISAQEKSLAEEDDDVDAVGFYYDGVWSLFVLVLINSTVFPIIYGVNAMKGKYDNLPKWVYQIINFIEDVFLPFFGIQVVGQKKKGIRGKRQFKRKRD
ncbi:hypothetical protein QYM36_009666, partial [Artemia franciscana]